MKYKPEQSFRMAETNWRPGIDSANAATWQSSLTAQSVAVQKVPAHVLSQRMPRVDKNASDDQAIFGGYGAISARKHYRTVSSLEYPYNKTAAGVGYQKTGPAFDRLSACRTNYSLGPPGASTSTDALSSTQRQFTHPSLRVPQAQAPIGGWTNADGTYRTEMESQEVVRRGGGGGEGNLGVRFSIITGKPDGSARGRNLQTTGPRKTLSRLPGHHHYTPAEDTDRFGDSKQGFDLLAPGRPAPQYSAPPVDPGGHVRPNVPGLATRPW